MIKKEVIITVEEGLQARSAAQFVQTASSFRSNINLVKNKQTLAAKSIMGIMGAAIRPGEKIILVADGVDEEKALATLEEFLLRKKNNC